MRKGFIVLTLSVVLLATSTAFAATTTVPPANTNEGAVRATAVAFLEAWKNQDAKGFCRALISKKEQLAKKTSTKACVSEIKKQFISGQLPAISSYRIRKIELFRNGNDAFVDAVIRKDQNEEGGYLFFRKKDGEYLLKGIMQ